MSVITLTGDTTKTLGEFLPAPYIDAIELHGEDIAASSENSYKPKLNLVFPTNTETNFYDSSDGSIVSSGDDYFKNSITDSVRFYVMTFYVNSTAAAQITIDDDPDGVYNKRLPIKYYDQIISGEMNPYFFLWTYNEDLSRNSDYNGAYNVRVDEIELGSTSAYDERELIYDQEGNEYSRLTRSPSIPLFSGNSWTETDELKFIVFSTTIDFSEENDTFLEYPDLADRLISDISFETIFEEGDIVEQYSQVYVDANDEIYQETPLLSTDTIPHKIKNVTHDEIVSKFNSLLDGYSAQYNADSGFDQLKKMMNNVYSILETKKDDPGILVTLKQLIRVWPNKDPRRPIGKLFKRFRSNIVSLDTAIRNGDTLSKKLLFDSKIYDYRDLQDEVATSSIYVEPSEVDGSRNTNVYSAASFETTASTLDTTAEDLEALIEQYNDEIYDAEQRLSGGFMRQEEYDSIVVYYNDLISETQGYLDNVNEQIEELGDTNTYRMIYSSNLLKRYTQDEFYYYDDGYDNSRVSVVFGMCFFDYEKALHKTSQISKVYSVKKLENMGMLIPFQNFQTTYAIAERYMTDVDAGTVIKIDITSEFADDLALPKTIKNYVQKIYTAPTYSTDNTVLFANPREIYDLLSVKSEYESYPVANYQGYLPYMPRDGYAIANEYSGLDDLQGGWASSLICRPLADISSVENNYGLAQSDIENYRLMTFQLLDYRLEGSVVDEQTGVPSEDADYLNNLEADIDDSSGNNGLYPYMLNVYVKDTTAEISNDLVRRFSQEKEYFDYYAGLTSDLCSFNEDTLKFNDSFVTYVTDFFDSYNLSPWVSSAYTYYLHLDLLTDAYGGDLERIRTISLEAAKKVNPSTGNLESIVSLQEKMQNLFDTYYKDLDELPEEQYNLYREFLTPTE
jgi:hypothetical protein